MVKCRSFSWQLHTYHIVVNSCVSAACISEKYMSQSSMEFMHRYNTSNENVSLYIVPMLRVMK